MATLFELIGSKAEQIYYNAEYSSDLEVDKGVEFILDFINKKMNLLKPEDFTIKIEEKKETPYVTVEWRILSFVIHNRDLAHRDLEELNKYFKAIMENYLVFKRLKTEKLFLDETIRIETKENKILFIRTDPTIPNRIEMESDHGGSEHFIVRIYQAMN